MCDATLNILQVNTFDVCGGAEKIAWDLLHEYEARGHDSHLAVGRKGSSHPRVIPLPNDQAPRAWSRFWWRSHERLQPSYGRWWGRRLCRLTHRLAAPMGALDAYRGLEDFHYPGTWRLLDVAGRRPDVIHAHNLHACYFDLRALPWLSEQVPLIVTLHDAWLLTGHCAHSLDCGRWQAGCGRCPGLTLYPAVRRDATARNWQRKRDIFARCRLHVATPCRWLMDLVDQSMLAPAIADARIIPYGVDLSVFHPGDAGAAREALNIPHDAHVLLFVASGLRANPWKDYRTLHAALGMLGERRHRRPLLLLALGESAPPEHIGSATVRYVPFESDPRRVAAYYQAADVYVHAARADTFPNTILEALACGLPVVATAVGGIPEQITPLNHGNDGRPSRHAFDRDSTTEAQRHGGAVKTSERQNVSGSKKQELPPSRSVIAHHVDAITANGGACVSPCLRGSRTESEGPPDAPTGILVRPGDAAALADAVERLLSDDQLRGELSANATADARGRFDLRRHADDYLNWYCELLHQPLAPNHLANDAEAQAMAAATT